MRPYIMLFLFLAICFLMAFPFYINHRNEISDAEISIACYEFCKKVNIECGNALVVVNNDFSEPFITTVKHFMQGKDYHAIVYDDKGKLKLGFIVDITKNVKSFTNSEAGDKERKKYNVKIGHIDQAYLSNVVDKNTAINKVNSYAKKISLANDARLSAINLDLQNRFAWTAKFVRTNNGFRYENDTVHIDIMPVSGELYRYGAPTLGKPCPTDVKISKQEAISKGWKKVASKFWWFEWGRLRDEYEVKSTELLIVQPNTFLGFVVPWASRDSRLAWVIIYGLKHTPSDEKRMELNYHDQFKIYIDAANGRFLGGMTGRYK